jgi:hypothetical protein
MVVVVKKPLRSRFNRKLLAVVLVVIAAIVAVIVLELTDTTHLFHKSDAAAKVVVKAGNPTPAPKNNVSKGATTPAKSPATTGGSTEGGAKDTNGTAGASTDPGKWVVSQSGNITVKQPIANASLKSGGILSGSSKLDKVNFRLIDSNVGVIAQGTLSVVNGNFSGTLSFTPQGATGRLDVFSTDAEGVELNEVQISVRF